MGRPWHALMTAPPPFLGPSPAPARRLARVCTPTTTTTTTTTTTNPTHQDNFPDMRVEVVAVGDPKLAYYHSCCPSRVAE
jgi:hypothetical protein